MDSYLQWIGTKSLNGEKKDESGIVNQYERWDDSGVMTHDSWNRCAELVKRV